ncbi:MAG TPA: molybdopterin-guanine dinucleotide biosynthesis protein B [Coriobacteriia bacterium]
MQQTHRIPVVSVVGKSDSGKTTVMEQLIRALAARGYRVATVKHHVHEVDVDVPGKDSWRHARAGAVTTMISAPTQFAVVRRVERERTLEELQEAAAGADILLTEGFQRAGDVKVEVSRRGRSDALINDPATLFALVTDEPDLAAGAVPTFSLDQVDDLAELVERTFLTGAAPAPATPAVPPGTAPTAGGDA